MAWRPNSYLDRLPEHKLLHQDESPDIKAPAWAKEVMWVCIVLLAVAVLVLSLLPAGAA